MARGAVIARPGGGLPREFPSAATVPLPGIRTIFLWTLAAGLAVVFVNGYMAPFFSNQNNYFLHGLAAAGYGQLSRDWLTAYPDSFPLFSWLITAMYWLGRPVGDALAFFFHVLFCGVYGLAVLLICRRLNPWLLAPRLLLPFLTLMAVFHSHVLARMTDGLTALPVMGVALFYPLGSIFQPQAFALLLLLGIAAFVWNRPMWAAALVALASALHLAFLPCGGLAVVGMLIAHWRAGMKPRRILLVGATALLIALPQILYILTNFAAGDPDVTRSAHTLLAEFRGPHHVLLHRWLLHPDWGVAPDTLVKVLLCMGAIIIVRRTPLVWVLTACVGGMGLLTLIYAVTGNPSIGVAYPWRGFALIVPLSTALVTSWALARLASAAGTRPTADGALQWLRRGFRDIRLLPKAPAPEADETQSVAAGGAGLAEMARRLARSPHSPSILTPLALCLAGLVLSVVDHTHRYETTRALHAFVRTHVGPSDLYLVPAGRDMTMMAFRLETGAPVFVDFKTHPLTAAGFLEWYRRIRLAAPAFDAAHRLDCGGLRAVLAAETAITHVVSTDKGNPCPGELTRIHSDAYYSVWALKRP